jgi:hypothetical protein
MNEVGYIGVDGWIILKWILEKWDGATDWIYLAQDMDRWAAFVNARKFLSNCEPVSFSGRILLHGVS